MVQELKKQLDEMMQTREIGVSILLARNQGEDSASEPDEIAAFAQKIDKEMAKILQVNPKPTTLLIYDNQIQAAQVADSLLDDLL